MATRAKSEAHSSARPTGTITFLFSDIEGSTARWQQDRGAMATALGRHDALMRAAIEQHGGYIFKTVGDAFCAAFATAPRTVAAALDAQRALLADDFSAVGGLPVRMALHSGDADERDGDYFGPAVNRVARLLAIGHGGQVLVSGACAELVHDQMPAQGKLRDLGAHRLKDLAHPEHVYQLVAAGLQEEFPALRSVNELPNNLPRQLTSFVGREEVMADVVALIQSHALVTLVGAGGSGKTRCATQVGAELLDGSGDGVWLAELAPISDPSLVTRAIAQALNVQEQASRPLIETLTSYLKRKRLLLILDNCEHVIDEVRTVAASILGGCTEVRILATSREALNIRGEEVYRMPSLLVPPKAELISSEETARYGAMQLFADRARSADKRFVFTDDSIPCVAEICRKLDGMPLAIELAAARVKVLSPQQLEQKLDERFRLLTTGDRSALPRHQTMRALIDWSYDLLSETERRLFRKLSVFAGGFTLESAASVCSEEAADDFEMVDLLTSLVDKSLIQAEQIPSSTRYRLLESTRQYGRERLAEHGELASVASAHASAFAKLAEDLDDAYETMPDSVWGGLVEPEMENWRAALEWTLVHRGNVTLGQRLAGAMRWTWSFFAPAEGRKWVRLALETTNDATDDAVIAALDLAESQLDIWLGQYKLSNVAGKRALERYARIGDARRTAEAKWTTGRSYIFVNELPDGEAVLQAAYTEATRLHLSKLKCWVLPALAEARQRSGDLRGARIPLDDALATATAIRFERMQAVLTGMVAEYEFRCGDAAAAERLVNDALVIARARKDRRSIVTFLSNLACYLVALRRFIQARSTAREALTLGADNGVGMVEVFSLQHLAAIAALASEGDSQPHYNPRRAARILGYTEARLSALEAMREYTEQHEYDAILAALHDALGHSELAKMMDEGRAWSEDQAIAEAMLI